MNRNPKKHLCTHRRAFTLIELLVVTFITGLFITTTAPIMQETLTSLRTIQTREMRGAVEDTWTSHLRTDLWSGRQVTLKTPDSDPIVIAAAKPGLAAAAWDLNPQTGVTRTIAPTPDSDGIKIFQLLSQTIVARQRSGALCLTITQPDNSQPTLYVLPLQTGAKP